MLAFDVELSGPQTEHEDAEDSHNGRVAILVGKVVHEGHFHVENAENGVGQVDVEVLFEDQTLLSLPVLLKHALDEFGGVDAVRNILQVLRQRDKIVLVSVEPFKVELADFDGHVLRVFGLHVSISIFHLVENYISVA